MTEEVMVKGKTLKEYQREYRQRPEVKEREKKRQQEYYQRPEVKKRMKEYGKEYRQRPEVKERRRKKDKEYQLRPEVKERRKEYYQRPEVKERQMERQKMNKLGDVDNIRALCLKHGFSEEAAEAIAMDGELLDKKLKKRVVS